MLVVTRLRLPPNRTAYKPSQLTAAAATESQAKKSISTRRRDVATGGEDDETREAAGAAEMGKLARLVDGIKEKIGAGGKTKEAACNGDFSKLDKTGSMRAEISSRLAQKLIAKNLALADSITGSSPRATGKKKMMMKRFFAF